MNTHHYKDTQKGGSNNKNQMGLTPNNTDSSKHLKMTNDRANNTTRILFRQMERRKTVQASP